MPAHHNDIHDPTFVAALFDEMAKTYGLVNVLSSFGFCWRWRRQCVAAIRIEPTDVVLDAMCGTGELWSYLVPHLGPGAVIKAVDFSQSMCMRATRETERYAGRRFQVQQLSILHNLIPDGAVDVIVSSFGLKTFSEAERGRLAGEIFRLLRPGGRFSLIEISIPPHRWLKWPYLFYLRFIIPRIGQAFLGNPDNYRMLGIYATAFQHCKKFSAQCASVGLSVELRSFFGGCATAVVGTKPQ